MTLPQGEGSFGDKRRRCHKLNFDSPGVLYQLWQYESTFTTFPARRNHYRLYHGMDGETGSEIIRS